MGHPAQGETGAAAGAIRFTQRFRKEKVITVCGHRPKEQDLLFHMSQTLTLESNGTSVLA